MARVAVLVPCYNESLTIAKVVGDFKRQLPQADIYVYDNNSTDGTAEIARNAGAIVRAEPRQGKGNVVRTMFREIEADCYIMVDGDDTYPAENAAEMARLVLEERYDMVIGDRLSSTYFTENKRPFHNGGNVLVRGAINYLFKSNVKDILTGYRAFSRTFVKCCPVLSPGFAVETEITIHALDKNAKVVSIPVNYTDRPEGSESKLSTISDGVRVIRKLVGLFQEYRPLAFYGAIALLFLLVGVVFLVPVLVEFARTGLVPKFPSFIASGIFAVLSIITVTTGIQADGQAKKHRQLFELMQNLQAGKTE